MKKHYAEIDKLRGIAICMVLLYHSIIVFPVNLHEIPWCSALHSFLWKIEMPLFFLVSGFCISFGENDQNQGTGAYGSYVWKKVKRIFVPHVVFGLLDIVPRIIPNPLVNEQMEAGEAIWNFLLYGGSDWFLWVLFLLFLIFPAVIVCYRKGTAGKAAVILFSLVLYFVSGEVTDVFLLSMAAEFQVFFLMGYVLRREIYEKEYCKKALSALAGGVGMVVLYLAGAAQERMPGMLLFVTGGTLCFLWLAEKSRGIVERLLLICGRYSLQMYLLGGYVLVLSRTLLISVLGMENPVGIILGNFSMDLFLTITVTHFVIRPVKLFRFLCGLPEIRTRVQAKVLGCEGSIKYGDKEQ
ncbi:MAG: acyltransferase [Clostridiales bacterium]|nr:acyltransferase [Clostridiales bacterium]